MIKTNQQLQSNNQSLASKAPPFKVEHQKKFNKHWVKIAIIIGSLIILVVIFSFIGYYSSKPDGISLIGQVSIPKEQLFLHTDDDPKWGEVGAPVTIIEFADFQCSFCLDVFPVIRELLFNYQDKIYLVFRDFPDLINHPQSGQAAEAANCAQDQGKFWPMHDKLFINQENLTIDDLKNYALELGLNIEEFNQCLESGKYQNEIQEDYQDGLNLGVFGTPTFYINGYQVSGSIPKEVFTQIVDFILANQ